MDLSVLRSSLIPLLFILQHCSLLFKGFFKLSQEGVFELQSNYSLNFVLDMGIA